MGLGFLQVLFEICSSTECFNHEERSRCNIHSHHYHWQLPSAGACEAPSWGVIIYCWFSRSCFLMESCFRMLEAVINCWWLKVAIFQFHISLWISVALVWFLIVLVSGWKLFYGEKKEELKPFCIFDWSRMSRIPPKLKLMLPWLDYGVGQWRWEWM